VTDVLTQQQEHVATITLNRPERLNAISGPMLKQLSELLVAFDADPDVRVIVLKPSSPGWGW
jgi:enoyl-CoA hydratase/carnithine racemase